MTVSIRRIVCSTALVVATTLISGGTAHAAESPVDLGAAGSYAVLAATTVTNTGPTSVDGNVGVHPGSAVDGFPPGVVNNGVIHAADAEALSAQAALDTAFTDAAGRTSNALIVGDLGGQVLLPGVHTGGAVGLTGTVTLDADGNPDAVFIIQVASSLITASSSVVALVDGAQACNVFWQVGSSATLGTGSTMVGTVMAHTSIWAGTDATIEGRLLALNGEVTLDSNTFRSAECAEVVDTASTVAGGGNTSSTEASGGNTTVGNGASTQPQQLPSAGGSSDGGVLAAFVLLALGGGLALFARRSPRPTESSVRASR